MGLREQKKAATRAEIRRQALRLFQEHGYAATTTERIALAANVSPSTFFRYFPTKEATVMAEDVLPVVFQRFLAQSARTPVTSALRAAVREVFEEMTGAEREADLARRRLLFSVPELRSALVGQYAAEIDDLGAAVARRTGRSPTDVVVRTWAGACIGVLLSVSQAVAEDESDRPPDFAATLDEALGLLEDGLPL
jgi:AcrR family transcriptional regulator